VVVTSDQALYVPCRSISLVQGDWRASVAFVCTGSKANLSKCVEGSEDGAENNTLPAIGFVAFPDIWFLLFHALPAAEAIASDPGSASDRFFELTCFPTSICSL